MPGEYNRHRTQLDKNPPLRYQHTNHRGMDKTDQTGSEKIVGMASRCFTPTESRYSNIERECLAISYDQQKLEYFLLGQKFNSGNGPLTTDLKNLAETSKIQCFTLKCLRFDIQVKNRPGKTIPVAGAQSRIGLNNKRNETPQQHNINFITNTKLGDGLVLKGNGIVVPKALRCPIVEVIHKSHPEEVKCIFLGSQFSGQG